MDASVRFDHSMSSADKTRAVRVLSAAAAGRVTSETPWGYVYRSLYADGRSYVGKRKIYPGEGWMDYVGSGSRLDPGLVVRKELVCLGETPEETHRLECEQIRREIDAAADRSMVLNVKVDVVDSAERKLDASKTEYEDMVSSYGMTLLDLYLSLGSEQRAADCIGRPRKLVHRFLASVGVDDYETLVDYSRVTGSARRPSGSSEAASTRTGEPECRRKFLRYPDDVLYHRLDERRRHVYGRICEECDVLFESRQPASRFCSRRCQRASRRIVLADKADVEAMLEAGCSFREIGARYDASETIAASYVNAVIRHVDNEEACRGTRDAQRSETNRWIMHVRWHVRRNKPNMACKWCLQHEGYDERTRAMAADRVETCANPLCSREFRGPGRKYCSVECSRKMHEYSSLFGGHMTQHVRKQRKADWCWFCSEGVDDAGSFAAVDKIAMMRGCDELRRLRGR